MLFGKFDLPDNRISKLFTLLHESGNPLILKIQILNSDWSDYWINRIYFLL